MEPTIQHTVDTKFELCRDVESVLKIGREFQRQDSMRGAHYDTVKLLCDTIEYLQDRYNKKGGSAAAMRAALEIAHDYFEGGGTPETDAAIAVEAALATPPRNCDRFATYEDARMAYDDICDRYTGCRGCPLNNKNHHAIIECFRAWLFAPAEPEIKEKTK